MFDMRRREFITLIGGAAAAWPLAARAQQGGRPRRIGMLILYAEDDPRGRARVTMFHEGLRQLGWAESQNLSLDHRWGIGDADRARTAASEIVALAPDVIIANGTPALAALHRMTDSIPIVFITVTDPVGAGYVRSLNLPGGNITGFSTFEPEIGGKWLELITEAAPSVRRVAIILDPPFRGFAAIGHAIERMAPGFGLGLTPVALHDARDDIESEIAAFAREPGGGLIVFPTAMNSVHRDRIISLAARYRLPAVYPFTFYCNEGGLLCYGFDADDIWRRSASYVHRILRGEKPADLPVQAPTKFELAINLKTTKALGLEIPPSLLARADEVIE